MNFIFNVRRIVKRIYRIVRTSFLRFLFLFTGSPKARQIPRQPGKILVISQRRMGDTVLSLPVFAALFERFPKATIHALTNSYVREIYDMFMTTIRIVEYKQQTGWRSLTGLIPALMSIRKEKFDLLIDLNTDGGLEFPLMARWSKAKCSIGYDQYGTGGFFDWAIPFPKQDMHFVDLVLNLLAPLGVTRANKVPCLKVPDREKDEMRRFLPKGRGEEGEALIGLHPGGYHPTQRWPVEYYAELADKVITAGLGGVVLCGGSSDQDRLKEIAGLMKETPHPMPALHSLKELAALLSDLDLLVCNNSGPLHLACAVGTTTVSFMGPTRPEQWWPTGEGHIVFRRDDLPCIGCNLGRCKIKTHDCMRSVSPEEVFEKVQAHMGKASEAAPVAGDV